MTSHKRSSEQKNIIHRQGIMTPIKFFMGISTEQACPGKIMKLSIGYHRADYKKYSPQPMVGEYL